MKKCGEIYTVIHISTLHYQNIANIAPTVITHIRLSILVAISGHVRLNIG